MHRQPRQPPPHPPDLPPPGHPPQHPPPSPRRCRDFLMPLPRPPPRPPTRPEPWTPRHPPQPPHPPPDLLRAGQEHEHVFPFTRWGRHSCLPFNDLLNFVNDACLLITSNHRRIPNINRKR